MGKVYIFQESYTVIPDSMKDAEAAAGVDRNPADLSFGKTEYYEISPLKPDEEPITALMLKNDHVIPSHWRKLPVRQVLMALSEQSKDLSVKTVSDERFLRSFHVLQWLVVSQYCGSCGEKNGTSPDELARLCPRCDRLEFPRITPAVIILITDHTGRALLAHNKIFKDCLYSLIAGYAEAGESLEEACRREIREELSIEIKNPRYITSQSWPFPNSLMIGFSALYAGGEIKVDGKEITDAQWFTREEINTSIAIHSAAASSGLTCTAWPEVSSPGSVSRYIINEWLEGKI